MDQRDKARDKMIARSVTALFIVAFAIAAEVSDQLWIMSGVPGDYKLAGYLIVAVASYFVVGWIVEVVRQNK